MAVVPIRRILDPAFAERYVVAAINVVDDLTLEAVFAAATELDSPLIVQTSVKTVKSIGAKPLYSMWRARADEAPVPVSLHLDHCPDREWITTCLNAGWNSVLFDGSHLDVAENTRQTVEVVAEAERHGAHVEGEIESVLGVEDGVGSDEAAEVHPVEVSARFIEETGVYSFAPAIGTAHGLYKSAPELKPERVTELIELHPIPMVLHGGTGLTEAQFRDLISRGCAKVNISTALKIAFVEAHSEYLDANPGKHDPPSMQDSTYTVGRRGVAGNFFVIKAVGAASERGAELDDLVKLGERVNSVTRTMGMALTSCTPPAKGSPLFELGDDEMEMGVGIHGEPGRRREKLANANAIIDELLEAVASDLPYSSGDDVALMINGLGGTPISELYILYGRAHQQLADRGINVTRSYVGEYCTSLDMAGASLTLVKLDDELNDLFDAPAEVAVRIF